MWHRCVGALFWVLLALMWVLLVVQGKASWGAVVDSAVYLGCLAAAVALVTTCWVRHNARIYRRKGLRAGRPEVQPVIDRDRLGRPVSWQTPDGPAGAQAVRHLVVDVVGDEKVYRVGERP